MGTSVQGVVGVFSRAAPTYDTVGPRHFEYFARRIVEFAGVQPDDRVLDVATGTGTVLVAAAERLGGTGHMVGVDLTAAMLERAAATVRDAALRNVDLKLGDAERLDLASESFNVVLCAFGLSSFANRDRALQELRRVLRHGGRLGIVDTFGWYFQHDGRWRHHVQVLRAFGAQVSNDSADSQDEVVSLVVRAGFVDVDAITDSYELVFQNEDDWWRWSWSHGTRGLFESVSPSRLSRLRRQLYATLAECREQDGRIHGTLRATLLRAFAPAGLPL
jgi:ubiquinone/menaquinone biosynthesis C-methylase UbiE